MKLILFANVRHTYLKLRSLLNISFKDARKVVEIVYIRKHRLQRETMPLRLRQHQLGKVPTRRQMNMKTKQV